MKPLYVLKVGGVVLTEKNEYAVARKEVIKRVVSEIVEARKEKEFDLIFVNGAGSFGHAPVKKYGLRDGVHTHEQKLGMVEVHRLVEDLNRMVWNEFHSLGVAAAPVHPMSCVSYEDGKMVSCATQPFELMLKHGITPLTYGDMVPDSVRGGAVVSGDDLAPYLGGKLGAAKIFMGTNTDGIFDKDPNLHKDAKRIDVVDKNNFSDVLGMVGESSSQDVTGGMRSKLVKTVELCNGVECMFFDATKPGNVKRALLGGELGTRIAV